MCFSFESIWTCSVPQNDHLNFSFIKDIYAVGKKLTRNGRKTTMCQSQVLENNLQLRVKKLNIYCIPPFSKLRLTESVLDVRHYPLTLFLLAMGWINPYTVITRHRPVEIGLRHPYNTLNVPQILKLSRS